MINFDILFAKAITHAVILLVTVCIQYLPWWSDFHVFPCIKHTHLKLHLFCFSFPGLSPLWLLSGFCSVCCHLGRYKNFDWLTVSYFRSWIFGQNPQTNANSNLGAPHISTLNAAKQHVRCRSATGGATHVHHLAMFVRGSSSSSSSYNSCRS